MQRCKHTQRHTGISPKSTPDFEHGSYMYTSHTNMCACNIIYMIDKYMHIHIHSLKYKHRDTSRQV